MTAGFKTVLLKARHAEQHGDGAEARRLLRAALREYPGNRKAKAELDRLSAETDDAPAALRKEAFAQGVDPDRLVFAAKMDRADHLARHVHADLFPDTCVENPHATANGAVRAGLSKLTLAGSQFAARVATSVPPAIDPPEPVTTNAADYEAAALDLARKPAKLAANRLTTPLFDSLAYISRRHTLSRTRDCWTVRPHHHQARISRVR